MAITIKLGTFRDLSSTWLYVLLVDFAQNLLTEIQSHMNTPEGREDVALNGIDLLSSKISRKMVANIVGGPDAVMDNYGTGSKMDVTNEQLDEYRKSDMWNPARRGTEVTGRPAGTYTNIYGEQVESSGVFQGRYLERLGIYEAQEPSHAFEIAVRWFMQDARFPATVRSAIVASVYSCLKITKSRIGDKKSV